MKQIHWFLLIILGTLMFMMPSLGLEPYVANSLQLFVYVIILTRGKRKGIENLSEAIDLPLVERIADCPENLNLECSIFKTLLDTNKGNCQKAIEKAVLGNINGHLIEKAFDTWRSTEKTTNILMKLVSSLFAKDALSAKKVLKNYIVILRENELLKNERRALLSEARFRARIMLIVSSSLMGFLSAINPFLKVFSILSQGLNLQQDPSQVISLFLYVLSITILVYHSIAFKKLFRTLLFSVISFTTSFLLFSNIINMFVNHIPN